MSITIALAGNPNSGKTTLFNALNRIKSICGKLDRSNRRKERGIFKGEKDIIITDLPGVYSLSPYTLEEVVARNYLVQEYLDAIINIIDRTKIERNLYLTTQLLKMGIPIVVAVNMMDLVRKNGDQIDIPTLSKQLDCSVVEISAIKREGIKKVSDLAIKLAMEKQVIVKKKRFDPKVESIIASVEKN